MVSKGILPIGEDNAELRPFLMGSRGSRNRYDTTGSRDCRRNGNRGSRVPFQGLGLPLSAPPDVSPASSECPLSCPAQCI